ncbi:MAG: Fe-S cluster assembly protein IscX [Janthinobacterium lividum]
MHWSDVEEIVMGLEENYSDEDLNTIKLPDLEEMVRSLVDFEDQETTVTKKLLNDVLEAWLEHRGDI